jgi:hypothetical protein
VAFQAEGQMPASFSSKERGQNDPRTHRSRGELVDLEQEVGGRNGNKGQARMDGQASFFFFFFFGGIGV